MPKLELLIYEPLEGGRFVAVNNSNASVPLGTVFTWLQSRKAMWEGESFHEEPVASPESIELKLTEIDFWRKLVGEVPRGHKAAVRFSGEGIADLQHHLSVKRESVYVFVATAETVA
jgi:hypothetical protein